MLTPKVLPETVKSLKDVFREDAVLLQSMFEVELGAWL